ncbi:MAG: hypothetical protein AAF668_07880 [Pseudomonadota bacterium]
MTKDALAASRPDASAPEQHRPLDGNGERKRSPVVIYRLNEFVVPLAVASIAGLAAVAVPAFATIDSFLVHDVILLFLPVLGGIAFTLAAASKLARGLLSGLAVLCVSPVLYVICILLTIFSAASLAGIG